MSVRRSPFGEWVITYYDPKRIKESEILKTVREGGCPRARIIRKKAKTTEITPIVTPGDTILLQLTLSEPTNLSIVELPKGWAISEKLENLGEGTHFLSVRTPAAATKGEHKITFVGKDKKKYRFTVELVSRVRG